MGYVLLFNGRSHIWGKHFIWSADGLLIVGLTPIGRATVTVLTLNRERVINIRAGDKEIGRHPPIDKRREKNVETILCYVSIRVSGNA